jgi:hypothetical protein
MEIHMRTTLIALALLAFGLVPPASAKDAPRRAHAAMNARAQMPAAKPISGRAPTTYIDANGRLHDPDMDWEIRNEEMHSWW